MNPMRTGRAVLAGLLALWLFRPGTNAFAEDAPGASERKEPTVCERLPASEMSALLGVEVVAEGKERDYKSTCTYTQEGTFLFVEVEFEPGAGKAGMEGAGMAAQSQPGVADPLAGLGDQAVMAGPMIMIRKGEDLLTLTFSGVDVEWAVLARQILERGHWPETQVAAGEGGEEPRVSLGSLGGIPGANELLKAFGAPSGAAPPEPPPAEVAALFDQTAGPGEPCPPGGPSATDEIAAEAGALVPMKTGMTLSYVWTYEGDQYDHECLVQVSEVGADGVTTRSTCPVGPDQKAMTSDRQVCRSDLREALTRETKFSPGMPVIIPGATYVTLSRAAFNALQTDGTTWHRYLEVWAPEDDSSFDVRGPIERTGTGTVSIIVNDKLVELPVIFAKGTLTSEPYDGKEYPFTLTVLDDANVPIVLDYVMTGTRFRINYTKITYPAGPALAEQLATDEPVAMYGIYFDFNSDTLLPESKPVLDEIAAVMQAHPDWRLGVDGHTDSIGGDDFNLDLSKRRAAAVKAALAADYDIDPERLETDGHGASQPRETNDTPEGRALNRRVELRKL
jgi:hypothetical protein